MSDPRTDFVTGFSSTPIEVALAVLFILLFILFFTIYFLRQTRKEEESRSVYAADRYREYLEQETLSNLDRLAVEKLLPFLPSGTPAYRLFEEQGLFNRVARSAMEAGELDRAQIAALRVKLGYAGGMVGSRPSSSTEIPAGATVELTDRRRNTTTALVLPPGSDAFRLRLPKGAPLPRIGSPVSVVFEAGSGVFSFGSHVLAHREDALELEHSEGVHGSQRRGQARRSVEVAVEVESIDGSDGPYPTATVEIGGGGATIYNPEKRYGPNDELFLTLHLSKEKPLALRGRVVRVTEEGELLHMKWVGIRESERDKVYRFLFRAGAQR